MATIFGYYWAHRKQRYGHFGKDCAQTKHLLPPSGGDVKVLSLNIFLRPPFIHTNKDDYKNERLREFIKIAGRFDVIALQEIFSFCNLRQRKMIQAAERLGFHYHTVSAYSRPFSLKIPFFDAGNLILSKFPIVEVDSHIYSAGVQIDGYVPKQVLYALLKISENHFLHFFTTHMQATYRENKEDLNHLNNAARKQQVREMADFVETKVKGSPFPALITGDFNVNARVSGKAVPGGSEEYKFLMQCLTSCGIHSHCVHDLVHAHYNGAHPSTYGDSHEHEETGKLTARDTILTHEIDHHSRECLDYIVFRDTEENQRAVRSRPQVEQDVMAATTVSFSESVEEYAKLQSVVTSPQLRAKAAQSSPPAVTQQVTASHSFGHSPASSDAKRTQPHPPCVSVVPSSTKVEPLFVADSKLPFTQLSDHYGVSTTLRFS